MDGNHSIPPLSGWPWQYDPARAGFGDIFGRLGIQMQPSEPSQPSVPSEPSRSGDVSDADIDALMYPVAPDCSDSETVIGIQTGGKYTGNKRYLPGIYAGAGIPFICHSCGKELSPGEIFIGDHQPPTKLREKAVWINPYAPGDGIYGRIVSRIHSGQKLTLHQFSCSAVDPNDNRSRTVKLQTNNPQIINVLGGYNVSQVTYSTLMKEQYLYPHCNDCSGRQGRIMW